MFLHLTRRNDSHVSIFKSKVKEWINSKPYRTLMKSKHSYYGSAVSSAVNC